MESIFLDGFGYGLGSVRQSVKEAEMCGNLTSTSAQLYDSGFEYHHRCLDNEGVYPLALQAVNGVAATLTNGKEALKAIDALFYATCLSQNGNIGPVQTFLNSRDVKCLMDFPASHLHSDFGLDKAFVMGINQTACTSLLGAIRLARNTLIAEPHIHSILCVTADRFPPGAIYEQSYNLISDGAAACIVKKGSGQFRLLDCHHITNGAMAQANDDETAGFYFNYTHRLVTEILARNQMTLSDLQYVVPQNTNSKAWQVLSSILQFDYEKVLMPTRTAIGHCISGDNIINLKTANDSGQFKVGDRILMPMAGFGLNWSAILLEKVA